MAAGAFFKHWSLRLLAPGTVLRRTCDAFKDLLKFDIQCHELMAGFEELYCQSRRGDFAAIRVRYRKLAAAEAERGRLSGIVELAGTVGHEINSPLFAALGTAELLAEDEEAGRYCRRTAGGYPQPQAHQCADQEDDQHDRFQTHPVCW